jgi:mRNA interferase RelE/StbE
MTQISTKIYLIKLSRKAKDFLCEITKKHAEQITRKIDVLKTDASKNLGVQLKGHEKFRKIKCGEYRIIFFIENQTLHISLIGKRNDDEIYKELLRSIK